MMIEEDKWYSYIIIYIFFGKWFATVTNLLVVYIFYMKWPVVFKMYTNYKL